MYNYFMLNIILLVVNSKTKQIFVASLKYRPQHFRLITQNFTAHYQHDEKIYINTPDCKVEVELIHLHKIKHNLSCFLGILF